MKEMSFNDLILVYCYYSDLAESYFDSNEWDWEERYCQYNMVASYAEKLLRDMCD